MYNLISNIGIKTFIIREIPTISVSLLTAELFFKFGSFTLETIAFLSTWLVFSGLLNLISSLTEFKTKLSEATE